MIRAEFPEAGRRLYWLMAGVAVPGVLVAAFVGGGPAALGFATGAVFSAANFWLWGKLVSRVGQAGQQPAGRAQILTFALRYFAFGTALYATIHYFEASLPAALTGIFVAVAAVLLEALIELIYGTTS